MKNRIVAFYYWLTPAFWAADVVAGANLRTAALEGHAVWQSAYYVLCLVLGGVIWKRPSWTRLVGLTESSVNILLSILGVMIPYYRMVDTLAAGGTLEANPFTVERIVSFLLASGVWVVAFYSLSRPGSSRPWPPSPF